MKLSRNSSLLAKLLDLISEEIPSDRVLVVLDDEGKHVFHKESHSTVRFESKKVYPEIIKKVIERKQPFILNGFNEGSPFFETKDSRSILCLPLLIEKFPVGAIYLERGLNLEPFSKQDLELLIVLSRTINFILRKSQEFKKIQENHCRSSSFLLGGQSKAFRDIVGLIYKVKDSEAPVFICGESGTGKELVAKSIHLTGNRQNGKFVAINCGAIPDLLLESELFGYAKGAFTGALRSKPGLIEEANGGTFFLDEIGDLSLPLQAKLLRLLQEKEIRRIGENHSRFVDVRFISATNKNIEKEIERGNFREDLYYRLKIISIEISPLRERKDDILFLLNHFLEKYCREMNHERKYLSPRAVELLMNYSWPGNVRELQNEIQKCLIFAGEEGVLKEECLSLKINPQRESSSASSYDFFQARAEFEKRFLNQALTRWNYNRAKTADEIGLSRQGLFKQIKKHRIEIPKK